MRPNCCHRFLAFNLKFLNFLQLFLGISTVIYSSYVLNQWQNQVPITPPPGPLTPGPNSAPDHFLPLYSGGVSLEFADQFDDLNVDGGLVSGLELDLAVQVDSVRIPDPWFIYFLMAVGFLLCCMSCIGHIAAEAINGCCLCFYTLLTVLLILLEVALVTFIAVDQHWKKDLPYDPTGELEKLRSFIEENADMCKWVGITLLTVQALSLLLSLVLRAMVSTRRADSDIENDYAISSDRNSREPLINSQTNHSSALVKGEGRETRSDIWTTRIRQKYGLNNESSKSQLNQNASPTTMS